MIEDFASLDEGSRWTFDRIPEMPLLGFLAGSFLSLGIWLGAVWIALRIAS